MKDNGKMIRNMVKDKRITKMVQNIKDNLHMENEMGLV